MGAAFDTLQVARTLREDAHFRSEQAEGIAGAGASAMQGDVATKNELQVFGTDLRQEIKALRTELHDTELRLKAEIQAVRTDLHDEIQAVRTDLHDEIQAVRTDLRETELRLKADLEAMRADIVKWVFGAIGFQTLVIVGAAITLARVMGK